MSKLSWLAAAPLAALVALTSCSHPKKSAAKPNLPKGPAPAAAPPATPQSTAGSPQTAPPDAAAVKNYKQTEVIFPSGPLQLHGFLTKPPGAGPFPAIVYNHGSEQQPGEKIPLRNYFVSHGMIFWMPHRRGQGHSPGVYIGDSVKKATGDKAKVAVVELDRQNDDVVAALTYLKTLPYVNQNKIIVGGCSYGGIQTLLSLEKPLGFKLGIDWAGDAESWHNNLLRKRLLKAVDGLTAPVFFLQAENDYTVEPTLTFAAEANKVGKVNKSKVFPPHGTSHAEGHGGFCAHSPQEWGGDVWAFIQQYMR